MKYLRDKYVVVTGAGGGFGTLLSERFLAAGSIVIASDKDATAMDSSSGGVFDHNGLLGIIEANLNSDAGCTRLHRAVEALAPRVDILVNNAGIGVVGMFANQPADRWQELLEINLSSPLRLTHHFLPGMIAQRSGHIVNISSVAGILSAPGLAVYSATKAGLRGFSDALRHEVRRHRIAVTTVYPFFARTNILRSPYFGPPEDRVFPADRLCNDPAQVVDAMMRGISRRRPHVYPDPAARSISMLLRLSPGALSFTSRMLLKPPRRGRR